MEIRTFYSDETKYYRTLQAPKNGGTVHILFRTGRFQARSVLLCLLSGEILKMKWEFDRNNFDFYGAFVTCTDEIQEYYFAVTAEELVFYDRTGVKFSDKEIIPFQIIPGFDVPEWSKGALYYQILPDRFCNGDKSNDPKEHEYLYDGKEIIISKWTDKVDNDTYRQFYGGDLKGIIDKLSYLSSLGIEALYLNPIFESPSSHKYDCADYEHVDTHLGVKGDVQKSDALFGELISKCHKYGIRVIIDGVFNHCSSDHKWFSKEKGGAYGNPDSPYHNRFRFFNKGCTKYDAWWDIGTLPKLNYEGDPSLTGEICSISKKWLSTPYNADGYRLDVAADIGCMESTNHGFFKEFRKTVKKANPDALIMAEHYDNPKKWLKGDEWDAIMNYQGFMEPISWFFTGVDKHSDNANASLKGNAEVLCSTLKYYSAQMPFDSLLSSLNQLDNHDHSRFLTRTNGMTGRLSKLGSDEAKIGIDKWALEAAAAFMYFWPGSPGIYYGDEAGVCGFTDPDNRRPFPWGCEDKKLVEYFTGLGSLRKKYAFIKDASVKIIYAKDDIFAFARFTHEKAVTYVVSAALDERNVTLPFWSSIYPGYEKEREVKIVLKCCESGFEFGNESIYLEYGNLDINLKPHSALVIADE